MDGVLQDGALVVPVVLAAIVAGAALFALAAAVCQLTWPLRAGVHHLRAHLAMREFERAFAQWTHPASR